MTRQRWTAAAAMLVTPLLASVPVAVAAGPVVPPAVVCDPQLFWWSPGGPSIGGTDGLPTHVLRAAAADVPEDDGRPDVRCVGNVASGLSIVKPGDRHAWIGRHLLDLQIWFAGKPLDFVVAQDDLLEAVMPPRPDGEYPFEFHYPSGEVYEQGGVIYRSPGPVVTHVINLSGGPGAAGDEMLVTGARLFESTIRVNDQPVPIVVGSNTATALRFTMPDLPAGADGRYRLDVSSWSGVTDTTFTADSPRPAGPVVVGLDNADHANLSQGFVGASMTVRGWGLAGARVRVDGIAAKVTENFDDELTFVLPVHGPGQVDVTVSTGRGSTFTGSGYVVTSRLPRISSITRRGTSSPVVAAGDVVVVTGSHLSGGSFTVDDVFPPTPVERVSSSDSEVVLRLGEHAPAVDVPVRVLTGAGRAVGFVNVAVPVTAPVLTRLAPASGPTTGGQILVRGTGFSPFAVAARMDGKPVPAAYVDPTTVKLLLPAHPAGTAKVSVTVANAHRSTTTRFDYRYVRR